MRWDPVVIVLAAGRGQRFRDAGGGDKLDAAFGADGRSVREHLRDAVRESGLRAHWVERAHTADLAEPGMGDSIARGVSACADADGWLILPADLPLLRPATLQQVAAALRDHPAVVPVVDGQRGHPVGFRRECGAALCALRGELGARALLQRLPPLLLDVDDIGAVTDVDTPQQLQAAQRWRDLR